MDPSPAPTFPTPTPWVAAHLLPEFDLLDFAPDTRVLDVGCGRGRNLLPLLAAGVKAEGVDCDPACVAECQRYQLPAVQGDAQRLPFADETFDGCLLDQVLQYTDPAATLREVMRVLKPGGKVLLTTHGLGYTAHVFLSRRGRGRLFAVRMALDTLLYRWLGWRRGDTVSIFAHQLKQLATDAGLRVEIVTEGPRFAGMPVFLYARMHKNNIAVAASAGPSIDARP